MNASGDPQLSYPVVHVTGTNGKGTTSRICAALLRAQGLRVGVYTSPHLETINERMAIDGRPIGDGELATQLGAVAELEVFLGEQLSWFEIVTASAYRWFADEAIDAAVVEVGLGGRFDATNVAMASVAAVTNVSLDHTEILGSTREQIASEKAGIIKPSSVLVLGEDDPALVGIFEDEAREVGAAALWRRHEDFGAEDLRVAVSGRVMDLFTPARRYEDVFLPLRGAHQADNAAVALAAAQAFTGTPLSEELVAEALASVTAPGRMEVVHRNPTIVLDGAHNLAGAASAGEALAEDFSGAARVIVVMGCLRGREPAEMLGALTGATSSDSPGGVPKVEQVIACTPPSPRAIPAEEVTRAARALGLAAPDVDPSRSSVGEAIELALAAARPDDVLLVTGSLYVVGAARTLLNG